jgi:type III restriction enzyme
MSSELLKLPVALMERTRGWQAAVFDAVQTQRLLEGEAQQEDATTGAYIPTSLHPYIRPIVLLQAPNSNEPVNVDVLRAHLVEELHIPAEQVKVATGTLRELDGVDLNARDCPVRYIVTVQALREGWDCPFAYVLCTVQSIRSSTAIEQLLGRVPCIPHAARRARPALNKALCAAAAAGHATRRRAGCSRKPRPRRCCRHWPSTCRPTRRCRRRWPTWWRWAQRRSAATASAVACSCAARSTRRWPTR